MKNFLITGANRGLGLAYTTCLLSQGKRVLATRRDESDASALEQLQHQYPERLLVYLNTLGSEAALADLAERVAEDVAQIDVLINNAGMLTDHETIETVRLDDLLANFKLNTAVPVILTQKLLPLLRRSSQAKIINISSSFASIGRKNGNMPPRYSYSLSKAAINMFSKTLAGELLSDGIIVAAIHPGWVQTGIGGTEARFTPQESARAVLRTIEGLTMEENGRFLLWDGREFEW